MRGWAFVSLGGVVVCHCRGVGRAGSCGAGCGTWEALGWGAGVPNKYLPGGGGWGAWEGPFPRQNS